MKKTVILSILAVTLALAGCAAESAPKPNSESEAEKVKTVNVKVQPVQPSVFKRYVRLVGTVKSENNIKLSAEVTGRIERYYVEEGDYVEKGEAILKINDDKLKKRINKLQAQVEVAREKYKRLKRIFVKQDIGSKINVIKARSTYKKSKAALEALKVDLKNTTVRAPFSGVVNNIITEVGERAAPGTPLVRLIATGNLKISTGVPSQYANVITADASAKVWFRFQPRDTLTLPITYVSNAINEESRTFDVEIGLPHSDQNYKVSMKANVKLKTFTQDSAITINREYIYPVDNKYVVYTLAKNKSGEHIANRQFVTLGPAYQDKILIKSGLSADDTIITVGSAFLQDRMRVNVTTDSNNREAQNNQ